MNGKVTYHQQVSYCGKPGCRKCREGSGHGPYWYAYQTVRGQTIRTYVGKHLPAEAQASTESSIADLDLCAVRVYLLGQFRLERRSGQEWQRVTDAAWQHHRVRALLGCLLSSPGRKLGREQLMEALWPDQDVESAIDQLNRAVHSLRQVFEPTLSRPATSQLLLTEREMLLLADQARIWVDADAFESLLTQAHSASDSAEIERLLEQAAAIYGGDFLPEERHTDWSWTISRRESLQRKWVGLLLELADLRITRGALASAVDPLDRLMTIDPTNEAAAQRLMVVLTHLSRRGEALRTYRRLATVLQQDYGIAPTAETRNLYEAVRQGGPSATRSSSAPARPAPTQEELASPQALLSHPTLQIGRSHQSPLVGRDQELEILRQLLLATAQTTQARLPGRKEPPSSPPELPRNPQCVLLLGEVGIGKTRLAEEIAREARQQGWTIAWGRVYPQESNAPYRLWTEALRKVIAQTLGQHHELSKHPLVYHPLRALLPELHEVLPQVDFPSPPPPEQEQLRLWEATRELLTTISNSSPLLIVLDDLQWADASSGELLGYLSRHLHGYPVMLVGTCRDSELPDTHPLGPLFTDLQREQTARTIHIRPLTNEQIRMLLSYLPETAVQNIQTKAAGNPFFAEELARVSSSQEEKAPALPDTINAVLDLRLGRLSRPCQRLMANAAVLGGSFEFRVVSSMEAGSGSFDEGTTLDLLEEALKAGMLTEEGAGARVTYHFWHPLLVSHLYDTLSAARRSFLHRRAADALRKVYQAQEAEWAATITHHLLKGGAEQQHIARYAELAGDHAYVLSAYPEAERHYRLAVEHLETLPSHAIDEQLHRADILERLAECARIQGNFEEARNLSEQVLEIRSQQGPFASHLANQNEAQLQALLWCEIGWTWYSVGDNIHARQCYRDSERILSESGVVAGPAWARLRLQQSYIYWQEGNYDEAHRMAQEALTLFEQALQQGQESTIKSTAHLTRTRRTLAGDPVDLGRIHILLGSIANGVGQPIEALEHLNTALAIFEQHNRQREIANVCCTIGDVHLRKAEHTLAQAYFRRSLSLAERVGDVPLMSVVIGSLGELATRFGELAEAETLLKRSLALAEQVNDQMYMNLWYVDLAIVLQDQGRLAEALDSIRHALALGRAVRNIPCIGLALVALGYTRILQAVAYAEMSTNMNERENTRYLRRARVTLQRALALEGMDAETRTRAQLALAQVSLLLGELNAALEHATDTLEEAQQYELTWLVARCQRLLGDVLVAQEQLQQATRHFEQSMRIFHKCGMRLEHARSLQSYGTALIQQSAPEHKDHQRGLNFLREARQTFSECGAALDLQSAERVLAAHTDGVPTPAQKTGKKAR